MIGILEGEGIGPQLTSICLEVLTALSRLHGWTFEAQHGGAIGLKALRGEGSALPEDVCDFCDTVFARGGAIRLSAGDRR